LHHANTKSADKAAHEEHGDMNGTTLDSGCNHADGADDLDGEFSSKSIE
jgi:hypothetical protein